MEKENIYTHETISPKKILSFVVTRMSLDDMTLSEISQTQTDKDHVILLMCGAQKENSQQQRVMVTRLWGTDKCKGIGLG